MKSIVYITALFCLWLGAMSVNSGTKDDAENTYTLMSHNKHQNIEVTISNAKTEKLERKLSKLQAKAEQSSGKAKSHIGAILFAFFLGGLGIHRFYLGYTGIGIIQLLTLGGLGIWALIDFIRIIVKDLKPKNGEYKEDIEKMENQKNPESQESQQN